MSEETAKAPVSTFPVGMKIDDRYEVLGILGTGGFATVYKARHLMIDRDVALKVMDLQKGVDPTYEERFFREAKIAAKIHHNNVVTIYDFGFVSQTGQPYIAMELLEGHDLGDELTKVGPLSPNRALILFRPVLEALGEGHRLGIVHKDLKPANLYLTDPGGVREMMKVLDFGVARMDSGEVSKLTSAGQLLGTPRYLAPEYIKSQLVTPAIDVYQMALIISEALTGQVAVDGAPYTAMMLHCTGKIQIADFLKTGPVGEVFEKAFSIDPSQRYQDADEFALALDSVAEYFESNIPLQGGPPQRTPESASHSSVNLKSRYADGKLVSADRVTGQHMLLGKTDDGVDDFGLARKKSKLVPIIALIVVLLGIGGVLAYVLRPIEEVEISEEPVEVKPITETLSFRIESEPLGASIQDKKNATVICERTPCDHIFTKDDLPVDLVATLEGYEIAEINLSVDLHQMNNGKAIIKLEEEEFEETLFSFVLVFTPPNAEVKEVETDNVVCRNSQCIYMLDTTNHDEIELEIAAAGYESKKVLLNKKIYEENPNVVVDLKKKVVVRSGSTRPPKAEGGTRPGSPGAETKLPPKPAVAEPAYGSSEYCKKYSSREVCVPGSSEFCRINKNHKSCQVIY
ncbi:MAG: serine/threonine-protein kinase [Bradymonadales bacterium]